MSPAAPRWGLPPESRTVLTGAAATIFAVLVAIVFEPACPDEQCVLIARDQATTSLFDGSSTTDIVVYVSTISAQGTAITGGGPSAGLYAR